MIKQDDNDNNQLSVPAWKQEVYDSEGRRRFHGAFTGGFSAGYYNTVGRYVLLLIAQLYNMYIYMYIYICVCVYYSTKYLVICVYSREGFTPTAFKSSRKDRATKNINQLNKQLVNQLRDNEDQDELLWNATHSDKPQSTSDDNKNKFTKSERFAGELPDNYIELQQRAAAKQQYDQQQQHNEHKKQAIESLSTSFNESGTITADNNGMITNDDTQNKIQHHHLNLHNIDKNIVTAVRMKLFGKLTRTIEAWQPASLLCKRLNIPVPTVSANITYDTIASKFSAPMFDEGETIMPNVTSTTTSTASKHTSSTPANHKTVIDMSEDKEDLIDLTDDTTPANSQTVEATNPVKSMPTTTQSSHQLQPLIPNNQQPVPEFKYPHAVAFLQSLSLPHLAPTQSSTPIYMSQSAQRHDSIDQTSPLQQQRSVNNRSNASSDLQQNGASNVSNNHDKTSSSHNMTAEQLQAALAEQLDKIQKLKHTHKKHRRDEKSHKHSKKHRKRSRSRSRSADISDTSSVEIVE